MQTEQASLMGIYARIAQKQPPRISKQALWRLICGCYMPIIDQPWRQYVRQLTKKITGIDATNLSYTMCLVTLIEFLINTKIPIPISNKTMLVYFFSCLSIPMPYNVSTADGNTFVDKTGISYVPLLSQYEFDDQINYLNQGYAEERLKNILIDYIDSKKV